ncbi:MAG TPA: glycosyltransferase [Chthoniobacterales bacterium]|nr:glycosyltransferase [Chthoniobacterales bacterium]
MQAKVGIFCPTFLKPEMLHVYRQVAGLRRVTPVVLAFKRENPQRFEFEPVHLIQRSAFRWMRRMWDSQLRKVPQQAYPSETRSLDRTLAANGCGLLHIYFGNNGLFWLPFLRRNSLPAVVSFHGADAHVHVASSAAQRLLRLLFGSCAIVLARSESLARSLVDLGCPPEKLQIQRTGIPQEIFSFVPRRRPEDGAWRLLQACRLIQKKGLETTILAFAVLSRQCPNANLTIAGDGPLRDVLRKLVTDLRLQDRVRFTGFVAQPELLTLYQESHLFLHPSEQAADGDREGIPNSLLEAMATGLPCIATRHGGIPEAITHMKSGILAGESEPENIANWLQRLTNDDLLRDSISGQAAQTIREKFDLKMQIAKLEDIYLGLWSESQNVAN